MRKRSNPSGGGDDGSRSMAVVGVAAAFVVVFGIVGVATDWKFGLGSGGGDACVHGSSGDFAIFETNKGTFVVELFHDAMPVTAANFAQYVASGHYDGTIIHRVQPNFVIQGGGFTAAGTEKPTRDPIPLEGGNALKNTVRTLSMARTQSPDSATSQFFVNLKDNTNLDAPPRGANDYYAVFGQVVDGWPVVERIAATPTTESPFLGDDSYPTETITVRCARLVAAYGTERAALAAFDMGTALAVAPGGNVTFPLVVRNAGTVSLAVNVTVDAPPALTATVEPGHAAYDLARDGGHVTLVTIRALPDATGSHPVTVTATPDRGDAASVTYAVTVDAGLATAPRTAKGENNLVQVRYVGVYADGRLFDTNVQGVWANEDFPRNLPPRAQPHTAPLKVWLGDGQSPAAGYTGVIPGFRDAALGLAAGETFAARLTPEQGYNDGQVRIFLLHVLSIDATG